MIIRSDTVYCGSQYDSTWQLCRHSAVATSCQTRQIKFNIAINTTSKIKTCQTVQILWIKATQPKKRVPKQYISAKLLTITQDHVKAVYTRHVVGARVSLIGSDYVDVVNHSNISANTVFDLSKLFYTARFRTEITLVVAAYLIPTD